MSTAVHASSGQHLVLYGVGWPTYEGLLRVFGDRPALRLTYDQGTLELMTLSHEHESLGYLASRLVHALTEQLGLPVKGGGSTTFRRRLRRRGLEPDASWWITNEAFVRGKTKIDLRRDPPPDLALEIDIVRNSLNRLAIYAALRVPEVWQYANQILVCHLLGSNGRYSTSATSRVFAGLAVADVDRFLSLRGQIVGNAIVQQFRAWIRQRFGPPSSAQTVPERILWSPEATANSSVSGPLTCSEASSSSSDTSRSDLW